MSDSPIPRWSTATTEKSRASVGISIRQAYHVWGQPCTSSSGGPSPPVTACRRSSPVSTYRLVNVPVNPAGRFGAPEAEPGPSGVGERVVDEVMGSPHTGLDGLVKARADAHRPRLVLAKRPERRANLFGKQLRLFPGGEVAALGGLVEVGEVGVPQFDPAARGPEDLVGERGEADRER